MKALLVSTQEGARAWMRATLDPAWDYVEAPDGLRALDMARAGGVGVVVTDESAEPYGAFGLTRELKLLPDAPVVIIVLQRAQDAWLAKWSGADRWLLQPVSPFDLAAAVEDALATRGQAGPATDAAEGGDGLERLHAVPGTPYTETEHTDR